MIAKEMINQKNPMSHEGVKKIRKDSYQKGYRAGMKCGFNLARGIYILPGKKENGGNENSG